MYFSVLLHPDNKITNIFTNQFMDAKKVLEDLKRRFPNEPEYHQAVEEVLGTIEEEYNKHPEFEKVNLIERLCIPDRVYQFRVTWTTGFLSSSRFP